ncbi:hypothetical protein FACS18942_07070 [Planctomycetales bacterium]|nr:hypothetical protein FACS18942_07070 [Planctomycetales bacterium]
MGFIGGFLGQILLNRFSPPTEPKLAAYSEMSSNAEDFPYRLQHFFGKDFCGDIVGKEVADFGCGGGRDVVEMVLRGAAQGTGMEIREELFERGYRLAEQYGVADRCQFVPTSKTSVDVITSVDAFEHFGDPENILNLMAKSLKPNGIAWISFGPPWYHPKGGHLFSVFPWAHLIFTEKALIEWRKKYRNDGAACFSEVAGGLNQMSISRFKKIVQKSPFEILSFECCPIKGIRLLNNPLTREFFSTIIRCRLRKKSDE